MSDLREEVECGLERGCKKVRIVGAEETPLLAIRYLPEAKRFATSFQFTTFHQAPMYSGRRF